MQNHTSVVHPKSGDREGDNAISTIGAIDLEALSTELRNNLVIKDRRRTNFIVLSKSYERCFRGVDAVEWLELNHKVDSLMDAIALGNLLLAHSFIVALTDLNPPVFKNEKQSLYRFAVDDDTNRHHGQVDGSLWTSYATQLFGKGEKCRDGSASSLLPELPWENKTQGYADITAETVAAERGISPLDDRHNIHLLENVHPTPWIDPSPVNNVYNLVVLGAGAGGLVSSIGSVSMGAKVALIESHLYGGDCTNFGCVPSKALIRCANVAHTVRNAAQYGVRIVDKPCQSGTGGEAAVSMSMRGGREEGPTPWSVEVDFAAVMDRMRKVRSEISEFEACSRLSSLGIDVFVGKGVFDSPSSIVVNNQRLIFRKCIICTGGKAFIPNIPGLLKPAVPIDPTPVGDQQETAAEGVPYLTNESIFNLTELPRRLVVVGGGPIGVELAQAFQRFGSQVTVLARGAKILDKEDEDAAMIVQRSLEKDGVQFLNNVTIDKVVKNGESGIIVSLHAGAGSDPIEISADQILIAAGRRPTVRGYGLEAANVAFSDAHGIEVNDLMRSVSNPLVYAAGDCCSHFQFTHAADWMARICIRNALFFGNSKFSDLIIPWCTFTAPEVAHVGLYPRDLDGRGIKYVTFRKDFSDNDRSRCDGTTEGFVKVHVKEGSDTILGCTIVGEGAGDMINEVTALMQSNQGMDRLYAVIHPYPTRADAIRQTGDAYFEHSISSFTRGIMRGILSWSLGSNHR